MSTIVKKIMVSFSKNLMESAQNEIIRNNELKEKSIQAINEVAQLTTQVAKEHPELADKLLRTINYVKKDLGQLENSATNLVVQKALSKINDAEQKHEKSQIFSSGQKPEFKFKNDRKRMDQEGAQEFEAEFHGKQKFPKSIRDSLNKSRGAGSFKSKSSRNLTKRPLQNFNKK